MRKALTLLAALAALTACGGGDKQSQDAASSSSAEPSGPAFDDLCADWCSDLNAAVAVCEFPISDPLGCRQELARGYDATSAVADALEGEEREPMGPVDTVLDRVDSVAASYDEYGDDRNCGTLELLAVGQVSMSGIEQAQWSTCQLKANTAALDMSSVAAVLENAES